MAPRHDDDPAFYLRPAPAGRSRESRIRLDAGGRFWHDGELVRRASLSRAFARWIRRHPTDGRFILSNGFDWCYLEVESTILFVIGLQKADAALLLSLSNGECLPLEARCLTLDPDGMLRVLSQGPGGEASGFPEDARFTRAAQLSLAPFLEERQGCVHLSLTDDGRSVPLLVPVEADSADGLPDTCSGA